jgi:ABC-type dipeptide/oligopeptide/nickel transport system ATPase component
MNPLLEIKNLSVELTTAAPPIPVVRNIHLAIAPGEIIGLAGESGCGKTVTALSVMGLLPRPVMRIAEGSILFQGDDLVSMPSSRLRLYRGKKIGMIFQEPMSALNPVLRCGDQIAESVQYHFNITNRESRRRTINILDEVDIPDPEDCFKRYPHELSGGMAQRVMIAMALIADPQLLIADEPTSSLDVITQSHIITILLRERKKRNLAILFISHDVNLLVNLSDAIAVMQEGRIVENAPVQVIFSDPQHPYTKKLFRSVKEPLTARSS